jgi:hypothetical protein
LRKVRCRLIREARVLIVGALFACVSCSSGSSSGPTAPVVVAPPPTRATEPVTPHATASAVRPPSESSPPEPPDPTALSVVARDRPDPLRLDAELGEWGGLVPELAAITDANPANAATKVAVVVSARDVVVAAQLAELAKGGLWIGIASDPPPLAPIGEVYTRSGQPLPFDCEFEQDPGPEGSFSQGRALTVAEKAACYKRIKDHEAFVASFPRRFERWLAIDASGVSEVTTGGKLVAVPGAQHSFAAKDGGAAFEAVLPLDVLPRLSEAPLTTLRLSVSPKTSATRPPGDPAWVFTRLPRPVDFEPLGTVRAKAFAAVGRTAFPPGLSYHPRQPLVVETVRHPDAGGPVRLVAREESLYRKIGGFGSIEVALVDAYGESIAVTKGGKVLEFLPLSGDVPIEYAQPTSIRRVVERGGDLHVIAYRPDHLTQQYGMVPPEWMVIAVTPDGAIRKPTKGHDETVRSDLVDASVSAPYFGRDTSEFGSSSLDMFGIRGVTNHPGGEYQEQEVKFEVSWRWDEARGMYVGHQKSWAK